MHKKETEGQRRVHLAAGVPCLVVDAEEPNPGPVIQPPREEGVVPLILGSALPVRRFPTCPLEIQDDRGVVAGVGAGHACGAGGLGDEPVDCAVDLAGVAGVSDVCAQTDRPL